MFNPARRNRNIGTAKQGHGQNNKLRIPNPCETSAAFFERLEAYTKTVVTINGHQFLFVVEQTRQNCKHAVSVEDLIQVIEQVPASDYGKLRLIILRQPKRKEELLNPVWGRLIYSYEFEKEFSPAIIIEANDFSKKLKWPKSLSPEEKKEFERLKSDGHEFIETNRHFIAELKPEFVRQTQLFRTLPHEFGHYVHYLDLVERPGNEEEPFEDWEKRNDNFFQISSSEKEAYAHRYAEKMSEILLQKVVHSQN